MNLIGIDPGLNGGIACVSYLTGHVLDAGVMPVTVPNKRDRKYIDLHRVLNWLAAFSIPQSVICIEQVSAMPGQGVTSMFRFGEVYGELYAAAVSTGNRVLTVRPVTWKKKVLGAQYPHDKAGAIAFCQETWPDVDLRASPRSRVPHDGIADALCLTYYASLLVLNELCEKERVK